MFYLFLKKKYFISVRILVTLSLSSQKEKHSFFFFILSSEFKKFCKILDLLSQYILQSRSLNRPLINPFHVLFGATHITIEDLENKWKWSAEINLDCGCFSFSLAKTNQQIQIPLIRNITFRHYLNEPNYPIFIFFRPHHPVHLWSCIHVHTYIVYVLFFYRLIIASVTRRI